NLASFILIIGPIRFVVFFLTGPVLFLIRIPKGISCKLPNFTKNKTMNLPESSKKRIAIIGGGFAGISLAKKLKDLDVQVVMVDKQNYHTFQPLLYQVSTGGLEPDSIGYPLRKILKRLKNFHFRLATVQKVDPKTQEVFTDIGSFTYDYLVI